MSIFMTQLLYFLELSLGKVLIVLVLIVCLQGVTSAKMLSDALL